MLLHVPSATDDIIHVRQRAFPHLLQDYIFVTKHVQEESMAIFRVKLLIQQTEQQATLLVGDILIV